ncbi:MAG: ABC transporter permease, partial [Verrucomicrobiales bacterium]
MKFFQRIWAIAGNTFTELVRMKVFYFLLIFGFLLTGASLLSVNFSFAEEFQMMRDVGLGAISLFTSLLAIAGTSILLPKEIEDRTLYTILAKPVPRHEYLLGKWLGACFLIGLALVLMAALFFALVYFRLEARSAELVGQLQGEDLEAAKANLRSDVLNVGYVPGLLMIYIRACLVASFTLLISTIATSSLFTLICAFMVFLIGHIQAVAREAMER